MTIKNRYRIVQLIAQGGLSKTFLAVDELELPAASCVVKQFLIQDNITIFEEEAEKLKELGKHPQIPALLDFFESDGCFYLVQELIDGMNLAKIIELEGIFNESQVWKLLNSLLPVLQFIHASDAIHGDIKPANIIKVENKSEQFFLVGFGNRMGSPEYAAPEQLGGKLVFASDLYSLGVTCIYLLTGVSPFNLSSGIWKEYLHDKISDRFSYILDKLLQNDPAQRFQSADEVMRMMGTKSKIFNLKSAISNFSCWQTLTGYGGLSSGVNSVAISPDNQILASGNDDKTIRLWNLATGEAKATLSAHTNFVQSVAFSPDGSILASASDDKTIKLWNLKQKPGFSNDASLPNPGVLLETGFLEGFSNDASLSNPGVVSETGFLEDFSLPNPGVFLKTDLLDFTLSEHTRAVKSVAFSPDGQLLASGSWDKTIRLWDWKAKNCLCTISGHQLQVTCVTFSCDGRYLASASFDRTVRLWDLHNLELMQGRFPHQIFYGHSWPVFSVAFSPKGDIIATGSGDNTIKLWDVKTGEEICTLLGHSWTVVAVVFCPDGETLISASWDKTVKLWQVSTGKEIDTLAGHLDAVSTVTVSPNGQIIASGSKDKTIRLWRRDA